MRKALHRRFQIEAALGVVTLVLAVVTMISREWIELIFGVDPDQGSGALEWGIVAIMLVTTAVMWTLAWIERRRVRPILPSRSARPPGSLGT